MATSKKTLADLRALHDKAVIIPNRIKAALAALKASGDQWIYETDFIRMAKPPISCIDISRFREQFKDYWGELPSFDGKKTARRVWFPTPAIKRAWESQING